MSKHLYESLRAEQEANKVAERFMDSSDVVGDMSRAFGQDLSSVRIHTDEAAAQRVEGTGADAFTAGNDIFFGRGVFHQEDPASRGLLAHELTHAMQQSGEGGMAESAPAGARQGGILDWFRRKFNFRKRPEEEAQSMQISAPLSLQRNTSPESVAYMNAMRGVTMTADQVPNRIPQASPGQLGGAEALANFKGIMGDSTQGFIKQSNDMYGRDSGTGNTANALASLGVRTSNTESARADKAYRGTLLSQYNSNVAQYMQNLETGGMDFSNALRGTEKGTVKGSPGSFVSGGKIDQIERDYLEMFGNYALSDQGVEYLKNTSETVGTADVFQGDPTRALNLMLQTMLTSTGAAYVGMDQNPNLKQGAAAMNTAREALRTLLMLPSLSQMDPQAMQALPGPIQGLIAQYQNLVNQIQAKMAGG